jgi:hypothetical protein
MSIFLYTQGGSPLSPIFIFDAELSEKRDDEVEWTEFPVEGGATLADFGWVKPKVYTLTGQVTASPLGLPGDLKRLQRIHKALTDAADRKQIVTMVTETWIHDVVIQTVNASRGRDEGEALAIDITLRTIERPTVETVKIDPSRLKRRRRARHVVSFKQVIADEFKRTTVQQLMAQGRFPPPTVTARPAILQALP